MDDEYQCPKCGMFWINPYCPYCRVDISDKDNNDESTITLDVKFNKEDKNKLGDNK